MRYNHGKDGEDCPIIRALPQKGENAVAVSKSQQKAVHKYVKANYDRMELTVSKGRKDLIKAHAEAHSESVNGFINRAIDLAMERDGGITPSEIAQQALEGPPGAGVALPSETVETAQRAAEAAGEALPDFVARAIATQAQRDQSSLRLGINPAAGGKLGKE